MLPLLEGIDTSYFQKENVPIKISITTTATSSSKATRPIPLPPKKRPVEIEGKQYADIMEKEEIKLDLLQEILGYS